MLSSFEDRIRDKTKKHASKKDQLEMFFSRDSRRRTYHLKEQKLGKAYAAALGLPKKSSAALKLEHWKVPDSKDPSGAGEFSTVAYEVIKLYSSVVGDGTITVDELNELLDALSVAGSGVSSTGRKISIGQEHARLIEKSMSMMNATEQKFFIRIILKDLKIGLGERTVFEAMHQDAMELFNTCSDIKRVCWTLHSPDIRLPREDHFVRPTQCFRPMLSQRNSRDLSDIVRRMRKGRSDISSLLDGMDEEEKKWRYDREEFIVEEKLDGERMQLHKMGDKYLYFSRKGIDYTYLYGDSPARGSGSLTPFIHNLFQENIRDCILDGEMLVWDPASQTYVPFGNLKTYAAPTRFGPDDPRPCFKVFDVLYISSSSTDWTDGYSVNLLHQPLWARKKSLELVFKPSKGVLELADCVRARSALEVKGHLEKILLSRGEGLVIKNPESVYVLGGRQETWIKVKPDYMDELGENIDATVIGAFWGQGRRGGRHASFMVGLRDDSKDPVGDEPVFQSFAKVGSGFSMQAFMDIKEMTAGKWLDVDRKRPPGWFNTVTEWPDQLIRPSDSFVLTIKAAEIVGGAEFGAGMTLRFPRAIKLREDMSCLDSMHLEEVMAMRTIGTKRGFGGDLRSKKKKVARVGEKSHTLAASHAHVKVTDDIFKGITFYVHQLKSEDGPTKDDIEKLVTQHGGKRNQGIPPSDLERVVIASEFKGTLTKRKGIDDVDVLSAAWVIESVKRSRKIPRYARFYIRALPETMNSEEYNRVEADEPDDEDVKTPDGSAQVYLLSEDDNEMDEEQEEAPADTNGNDGARREHDAYRSDDEPETEEEEDFYGTFPGSGRLQQHPSDAEDSDDDDDGDVRVDENDNDVSPLKDDLRHVALDSSAPSSAGDPAALTDAAPGMGAGLDEAHIDSENPMAPFVGYFDLVANAVENALPEAADAKAQTVANVLLTKTLEKFVDAGGQATSDLLNPDLTHIIVHKNVKDRYERMIELTSHTRE